jgi:hypothetical protein
MICTKGLTSVPTGVNGGWWDWEPGIAYIECKKCNHRIKLIDLPEPEDPEDSDAYIERCPVCKYCFEEEGDIVKPHPSTMVHIARVGELIRGVVRELNTRGVVRELNIRVQEHDRSKTMLPEVAIYNEMIPILNSVKYGTPEYKAAASKLGPAWEHHKKNNRHHPEYFKDGIDGMDLVDLIEMLCDWRAASERGKGNRLEDNLDVNQKKHKISDQLMSILKNTLTLIKEGGDV